MYKQIRHTDGDGGVSRKSRQIIARLRRERRAYPRVCVYTLYNRRGLRVVFGKRGKHVNITTIIFAENTDDIVDERRTVIR